MVGDRIHLQVQGSRLGDYTGVDKAQVWEEVPVCGKKVQYMYWGFRQCVKCSTCVKGSIHV